MAKICVYLGENKETDLLKVDEISLSSATLDTYINTHSLTIRHIK